VSKLWPVFGFALAAGCNPPGEKTTDLTAGYELIKHDGVRQVIRSDGNITVDDVANARVDRGLITGTLENGAGFELEPQSGKVRMSSGETR
jgi:hypothetical protein